MFNRADGYDTFACSDDVEREFIDKELGIVCENKPTPEESILIRKGELPPVYCAYTAKDGTLVQSCTTYMPLDYTGERSTYMVHNILFTPQEAESLFNSTSRALINPDMFDHDIEHFNITAPTAKPYTRYPEIDYKCTETESPKWLIEELDNSMVQRLIYCVLSAACGGVKSVFVMLPDNSNEYALRFFNTIYSIVPYYLRPQLSFATRVIDGSKYQSIKIKSMSNLFVVQPSKGAMLNFKTNQFTGMKDEDVQANRQIVEFFYNILENDAIREEFLLFADHAVKAAPALGQPAMKMLNNIVFLFRACSGFFDEKIVLSTDDRLLEYFTIYEKYRSALSSDFRIHAAKSLRRYPDNHLAIPPKLFTKIAKIYPTDLPGVKFIIMQVVLELIHMDIMRDKLFQFVKANYATQSRDEKHEIIQNISRVFYGGFLQNQILQFFQQIFLDEAPESQLEIMDKLLLSIRNKDVKDQILGFIETNIKGFTPQIRHNVYLAAIEHIQEGDELASKLIDIIDDNMPTEVEEERVWFELKLVSAAKAEQRKRTHPMIKLLATKQGFCSELVLRKVFNEELGKKAYNEVVSGFCEGSLKDLALSLKQAMPLFPDIDEETNERLFTSIKTALESVNKKFDLPSVIAADKIITQCYDEEEEPFAVVFWQDLSEEIIAPAVRDAIADVFRYLTQPQILDDAFEIADKYDSVKVTDGYKFMLCFKKAERAITLDDVDGLLSAIDEMPGDLIRRKQVGEFMKKNLDEKVKNAAPPTAAASVSLINFLRTGSYDFAAMYDKAKECLEGDAPEETAQPAKGKKKEPDVDNNLRAITMVLEFGNTIDRKCGDKMRQALYADNSYLLGAFNSYIGAGKNQERKKLAAAIQALVPQKSEFVDKCTNLNKGGSSKPSFLSGLFKKK